MTNYQSTASGTLPISDTGAILNLGASAGLSYTVPGTSNVHYRCLFSVPDASVWMGYNVTPTLPGTDSISNTYNQELLINGEARYVKGGDVLNFISRNAVTDMGLTLLTV